MGSVLKKIRLLLSVRKYSFEIKINSIFVTQQNKTNPKLKIFNLLKQIGRSKSPKDEKSPMYEFNQLQLSPAKEIACTLSNRINKQTYTQKYTK